MFFFIAHKLTKLDLYFNTTIIQSIFYYQVLTESKNKKMLTNLDFFEKYLKYLDTLNTFCQITKTHDLLNKKDPMQIGILQCPPEQVECTLFQESTRQSQLTIPLLEQVHHIHNLLTNQNEFKIHLQSIAKNNENLPSYINILVIQSPGLQFVCFLSTINNSFNPKN